MKILGREFPDCAVATLTNHNTVFKRFVDDCCRLSWKLAVSAPPYWLATVEDGSGGHYSEKLHDTLMQDPSSDRDIIDHYLWPALFDQQHGGAVLHRARVVLKQHDQNYLF